MKTCCITCRETPWRRVAALPRFAAAGLDVEWFAGIHGPTLALVPRLPAFDSPTYRMPSGQVGCWLSHYLLFRHLLDRGEEMALVLEDDAVPCPDFLRELGLASAELPDGWDVCAVGHCCTEHCQVRKVSPRVATCRPYPLCTHALLWRRSGLQVAVDRLRVCNTHIDIALQQLVYPHLNHCLLVPPLVTQDPQSISLTNPTGRWSDIPGWFDFAGLYDEQLRRVRGRPAVFVEVGSWLGRSTAYLAERIKESYQEVAFWAVDTWKGSADEPDQLQVVAQHGGDLFPIWQRHMASCGVLDWVRPIQAASVQAAAQFPDGSIDFCMIDGAHDYDSVRQDLAAWRPKIKPDGVLAGHDIDRDSVRRAVEEAFGPEGFRTWERCWIAR